jgi:hypothetical protein
MTDRPTSGPSTGTVLELAHTRYSASTLVRAAPSGEFRPSRPGERRGGRQKGTPNKSTTALKDAIIRAAELAGDELKTEQGGLVAYLKQGHGQSGLVPAAPGQDSAEGGRSRYDRATHARGFHHGLVSREHA